jgi:hypothetical protein
MRKIIIPVALALLLSANFLMILAHGLFNTGSFVTGGYLAALLMLLLLGGWRWRRRWS